MGAGMGQSSGRATRGGQPAPMSRMGGMRQQAAMTPLQKQPGGGMPMGQNRMNQQELDQWRQQNAAQAGGGGGMMNMLQGLQGAPGQPTTSTSGAPGQKGGAMMGQLGQSPIGTQAQPGQFDPRLMALMKQQQQMGGGRGAPGGK